MGPWLVTEEEVLLDVRDAFPFAGARLGRDIDEAFLVTAVFLVLEGLLEDLIFYKGLSSWVLASYSPPWIFDASSSSSHSHVLADALFFESSLQPGGFPPGGFPPPGYFLRVYFRGSRNLHPLHVLCHCYYRRCRPRSNQHHRLFLRSWNLQYPLEWSNWLQYY